MKIFIYKQKLEKKIREFASSDESSEKIKSLKTIQNGLNDSLKTLISKKIDGVSEARVRGDLVVLRDFVTSLNEKSSSEESKKVLKKINTSFESGDEDELFAIHTYVDEILSSNKNNKNTLVLLIKEANDEYLEALHSLKSDAESQPETPSIDDLRKQISSLNAIIAQAGNTKIQGVDIVSLKNQLNDAVKKMQKIQKNPNEINPEKALKEEQSEGSLEDNEHYGKMLNQMMGEPKEQAFDNGNTLMDLNDGGAKFTHSLPRSFIKAVGQLGVTGDADIENGLDNYLMFVDRTYDLNDVQKILTKKRKDRIMENLPHLCGKEVIMWIKQELENMFLDFQKAGLHPLKRIQAVKDLSYGLAEAVFISIYFRMIKLMDVSKASLLDVEATQEEDFNSIKSLI